MEAHRFSQIARIGKRTICTQRHLKTDNNEERPGQMEYMGGTTRVVRLGLLGFAWCRPARSTKIQSGSSERWHGRCERNDGGPEDRASERGAQSVALHVVQQSCVYAFRTKCSAVDVELLQK